MRQLKMIGIILFSLFTPCLLHGDSDIYVTKKDYPMAVSEADLDLFSLSMKEDRMGLWVKLRQEGRAWLSKPGIAVTIISKKPPDKVNVRAVSGAAEFWTYEDALRKK